MSAVSQNKNRNTEKVSKQLTYAYVVEKQNYLKIEGRKECLLAKCYLAYRQLVLRIASAHCTVINLVIIFNNNSWKF